jgi:methyl-accepting chemotaxis protein
MEFLKNLSIRTKLFLITIIPSLALLYFLERSVAESLDKKASMSQLNEDFEEVERISTLIHELQRERGFTLSFLTSKKEEDRDKIIEQEQVTNAALASVQSIYAQHHKPSIVLALLDSVTLLRQNLLSYPEDI